MQPAQEKKVFSAKHFMLVFANWEDITNLSQVI